MRLTILVLAVFLLAAASGCGARLAEETLPTADQVIARHLDAQRQATTWRSDTRMDISVKLTGSQDADTTMATNVRAAVDLPQKKMKIDTNYSVVALNRRTDMQAAAYFIQDKLYVRRGPRATGQWTSKTLSEIEVKEVWEAQAGTMSAKRFTDALSAASIPKVLNVQEIAGTPCYVVEASLDAKVLRDMLKEMSQQGVLSNQTLPFDVGDIFKEGNIALWFSRDTYVLFKYEMSASISTEQQGSKLDGHLRLTSHFSDHGTRLTIELPEEARGGVR